MQGVGTTLSDLFMSFFIGDTPIVHRFVNQYESIWNDKGSGAKDDVSIWRPFEQQSGFYPVGDVAVNGYKASTLAMTVSAQTEGALAPPASFSEIWKDKGSGAYKDVKILKMNPQEGYTCLGHVAHGSYGSNPDLNKYR